jgi:two-component sensor histidine kinase
MPQANAAHNQPFGRLANLSIGVRLFIILLIALLPLALISVFATQSIASRAYQERQRLLEQNVNTGAVRLNSRLNRDIALVRGVASQIALGAEPDPLCARLGERLALDQTAKAVIIYADSSGRPTCEIGMITSALRARMVDRAPGNARILPQEKGVLFNVKGRVNLATAAIFYPAQSLYKMADPVDDIPVSRFEVSVGEESLELTSVPDRWLGRMNRVTMSKRHLLGLSLNLRYESMRATPPEFLALFIPFLTVLAAAIIGLLVANRMLIEPMRGLQSKMRRYKTGEMIAPIRPNMLTAGEIEELDKAFFSLTEKVALDKHALDQGLEEQIRLTREVHHRVKNNLQIIASLISLHSRTAENPQANLAYTKIQRRVDALSVVQRNHYAGSEESLGINLRALVGELAGSFQAVGDEPDCPCIDIAIENVRIDQDVAVPVAFLLTEILDLVQQVDPDSDVLIDTKPLDDNPDKVLLTIKSRPLGDNPQIDALLEDGIDRVLAGLARQLRTPFNRDLELETVCVEIPLFRPKTLV